MKISFCGVAPAGKDAFSPYGCLTTLSTVFIGAIRCVGLCPVRNEAAVSPLSVRWNLNPQQSPHHVHASRNRYWTHRSYLRASPSSCFSVHQKRNTFLRFWKNIRGTACQINYCFRLYKILNYPPGTKYRLF